MERMRSFSFPKMPVIKHRENEMACDSPLQRTPAHSRHSSGASSLPVTPTSSNRSHNRWPSSSSSLAASPDSPNTVAKSALHDLVEDPAEREDDGYDYHSFIPDEPLCICDTPFCEHRRTVSHSATIAVASPEWTPGDDSFSDGDLPLARSPKRRRSGEYGSESLSSRLSRRWPSLSARWKDHRPTASVTSATIRSAPPSRSPSTGLPSIRRSLARNMDASAPETPPFTPIDAPSDFGEPSRPRAISRPQKPANISIPELLEETHSKQELASTPLLPPMMMEHMGHSTEQLQSPLQSPSVADPNAAVSLLGTPAMTPTHGGMPTPPLSSQPSLASFGTASRSVHGIHTSDIPPMSISQDLDPWSIRLGHANFRILPEPYLPEVCDLQTCKKLLDDWESARMEYMRLVARTGEHYGPTSQTYKFTEEKWAEIDGKWRAYHETANTEAGASTDNTRYQPLAETQPLSKMPSLNDPEQPAKFPRIDEADIVGPMVQYAKIQRRPSKKPAFLKLFTDPTSLLGGRAVFGLRR